MQSRRVNMTKPKYEDGDLVRSKIKTDYQFVFVVDMELTWGEYYEKAGVAFTERDNIFILPLWYNEENNTYYTIDGIERDPDLFIDKEVE